MRFTKKSPSPMDARNPWGVTNALPDLMEVLWRGEWVTGTVTLDKTHNLSTTTTTYEIDRTMFSELQYNWLPGTEGRRTSPCAGGARIDRAAAGQKYFQ
ncbi:hypothetical protein EVAR_11816_1 [Eumeta japonica]|uniref:Uncharacterized protein n=1 Tax=Eumeta variegata TaxID=151549 RepID=A0A4C1UPF5_EUMVA|nr:hypothetical protein EVAR_11816_1 [Eumeta japonica]